MVVTTLKPALAAVQESAAVSSSDDAAGAAVAGRDGRVGDVDETVGSDDVFWRPAAAAEQSHSGVTLEI